MDSNELLADDGAGMAELLSLVERSVVSTESLPARALSVRLEQIIWYLTLPQLSPHGIVLTDDDHWPLAVLLNVKAFEQLNDLRTLRAATAGRGPTRMSSAVRIDANLRPVPPNGSGALDRSTTPWRNTSGRLGPRLMELA